VSRQLDKILLAAAEGPGTIPEITRARVATEAEDRRNIDAAMLTLLATHCSTSGRQIVSTGSLPLLKAPRFAESCFSVTPRQRLTTAGPGPRDRQRGIS